MNSQVTLNEQSMEEAALKIRNATEEMKNSLEIIKTEIGSINDKTGNAFPSFPVTYHYFICFFTRSAI